jgi:hypothetical protein
MRRCRAAVVKSGIYWPENRQGQTEIRVNMRFLALVACTLVGGTVINAFEWLFHGILLNRAWMEASAALGKPPTGWSTFIPSNFILAAVSVVIYFRLRRTGRLFWQSTGLTAATARLVFWVIPTMALLPLNLFPPSLLWSVMGLGIIDCGASIMLMAKLYELVGSG